MSLNIGIHVEIWCGCGSSFLVLLFEPLSTPTHRGGDRANERIQMKSEKKKKTTNNRKTTAKVQKRQQINESSVGERERKSKTDTSAHATVLN